MFKNMMFALLSSLLLVGVFQAPVSANVPERAQFGEIIKPTCDYAVGKRVVTTPAPGSIGFKVVGKKRIVWRKREVQAGTYTVPLAAQKRGSKVKYVMFFSPADDAAKVQRSKAFEVRRKTNYWCRWVPLNVAWEGVGMEKDKATCGPDQQKQRVWALRNVKVKSNFGMSIYLKSGRIGETYDMQIKSKRLTLFRDYEGDFLNVSDKASILSTQALVGASRDVRDAKLVLLKVSCLSY